MKSIALRVVKEQVVKGITMVKFVKRFGENVVWEEYEREIKMKSDLVSEDLMVKLKKLRQTTYVQDHLSYQIDVIVVLGGRAENQSTTCKKIENPVEAAHDGRQLGFENEDRKNWFFLERIEVGHDGRQLGFENEDREI
uniref:Uncharacterized protein n=1 Tax=Tanacetum cinerariifolium TaxID=118510 RepID=A0A699I7I5_TANCI|nr:hypothetical protein [Tanacetum cinerariifolium]